MNRKLNEFQDWPTLAKQANWSVTKLAKACGVSEDTLWRHFRKHMGQTPKKWLMGQRQNRAIELLHDGSSVKQTAASLGYKQQGNFTRTFREFWGACPSEQAAAFPIQSAGK
jgi:transcriptional regulator GlxA family with amidase domain